MRPSYRRHLGLALALFLLIEAVLTPGAVLAQGVSPTPVRGYYYVVKTGDNWTRISRLTGVPISTLKQNNPQAIHQRDWLYEGERVFIPGSPLAPATPGPAAGIWYRVKPGDSWGSVANVTGVDVRVLWDANPSRLYPNRWLYTGEWLWIPYGRLSAATVTPTPTIPPPTPTPVTPTPAAASPTPTATATETPTATASAPSAESVLMAEAVAAAATISAGAQAAATVAAAAGPAATVVAAANTIATAAAAAQSAATAIAATGFGGPSALPTTPPSATPERATEAPSPTALAPAAPATPTATPRPARATAAPRTATPTPVPARTASGCLSEKVQAANQALDNWTQEGFQPAVKAYQAIITDTTGRACSNVTGELDLLRDFARYRLYVASIAAGQGSQPQVKALPSQIENAALKATAEAFQDSLKRSGSIVQACRDANAYAKTEASVWEILSDLGIPLKANQVCPLG